jgi:hypothetical protein
MILINFFRSGTLIVFRTCAILGDIEDGIPDIKQWSLSSNMTVLLTQVSTYLTGANFAVYEAISSSDLVQICHFYTLHTLRFAETRFGNSL